MTDPNERYAIHLDYPVRPKPRFGWGSEPHPELLERIGNGLPVYENHLERFLEDRESLLRIASSERTADPRQPSWRNAWFAGLDALALYGFLRSSRPAQYVEIGSGMSTKFARRAVEDHRLGTRIRSIDPVPRAEIDALCDEVVREPLEETDLSVFGELEAGDILFFDGSHRSFANTDVTVFFLEILPRLKPNVLVHLHDVYLPYDYPPQLNDRFYNEQYLLAAMLLAKGTSFEIAFPCFYYSLTPYYAERTSELWEALGIDGWGRSGGSFWIETR